MTSPLFGESLYKVFQDPKIPNVPCFCANKELLDELSFVLLTGFLGLDHIVQRTKSFKDSQVILSLDIAGRGFTCSVLGLTLGICPVLEYSVSEWCSAGYSTRAPGWSGILCSLLNGGVSE